MAIHSIRTIGQLEISPQKCDMILRKESVSKKPSSKLFAITNMYFERHSTVVAGYPAFDFC